MSLMCQCSWEMLFFKSENREVFKADRNKLFASNEKQIDHHTLMLDMLHSNMSVVFKKILWCGCCSLMIFVAKTTKGTELEFLCTQFLCTLHVCMYPLCTQFLCTLQGE